MLVKREGERHNMFVHDKERSETPCDNEVGHRLNAALCWVIGREVEYTAFIKREGDSPTHTCSAIRREVNCICSVI